MPLITGRSLFGHSPTWRQALLLLALAMPCLSAQADELSGDELGSGSELGAPVSFPGGTFVGGQLASIVQQGNANVAYLSQNGTSLVGNIVQVGSAQEAFILQQGSDLTAYISQQGSGNQARITQTGSDNQAAISQHGANNSASIVQAGSGLQSSISQSGNGQSVEVRQVR